MIIIPVVCALLYKSMEGREGEDEKEWGEG